MLSSAVSFNVQTLIQFYVWNYLPLDTNSTWIILFRIKLLFRLIMMTIENKLRVFVLFLNLYCQQSADYSCVEHGVELSPNIRTMIWTTSQSRAIAEHKTETLFFSKRILNNFSTFADIEIDLIVYKTVVQHLLYFHSLF